MNTAQLQTTMRGYLILAVVHIVSAEVCYFGNEPDSNHTNKLRWVLPVPEQDRCSCTRLRLGGVNRIKPERSFEPYYTDNPLITSNETKIRQLFNCSDGTSPAATPSVTTTRPCATTGPFLDCQSWWDACHTWDGVYTIFPSQYPEGLDVYCDMTTDSKGWIVFQLRQDGKVNFTRSWDEYSNGFGDKKTGEFWLGNDILRRLTDVSGDTWEMRVDLVPSDGFPPGSVVYQEFRIEGDTYILHVVDGTADSYVDCLTPDHNGQPFSTYDRDNDADLTYNCADELKGGWWFKTCTPGPFAGSDPSYSNLNGEYSHKPGFTSTDLYSRGIVWSGGTHPLMRSEMKMRRSS